MAASTRVIVTSQPDVACDVCCRRLLRGEQPDTFLADGRRRVVCELCAPRASAEGWVREAANHDVDLPPARPRRGRSLLDRLRQGRAQPVPVSSAAPGGMPAPAPAPSETARPVPAPSASPGAAPGPTLAPGESDQLAPVPAASPGAAPSPGERPDPALAASETARRPVPAAHVPAAEPAPATTTASAPPDDDDAGDGDGPEGPDAKAEEEPQEEQGSWRDAWMFVGE